MPANSSHFDLIVRGGIVVDGTGLPRRRVDVGVREGKVAALGRLDEASADEEIDATDLIVAPGIVDIHTHYDPQITFDPYASMSSYHGVTTVLAGNCGFSAAPVKPDDRSFVGGIFAQVENMDPVALSAVTWDEWVTFPEFLASRKGKLGVNFACYVGHSNLRRWVMGEDATTRPATDDEIAAMCDMAGEAMASGAAGLSSSAAPTHFDIDSRPVPSRLSDRTELLALAEVVGRFGAGSIAFLPASSIGGLDDDDKELLIELGRISGLPVIIQGLGGRNKVDAPTATWEASVEFLDRATAQGAPVFSMLIARPFDRPLVVGPENLHFLSVPSWMHMLNLPATATGGCFAGSVGARPVALRGRELQPGPVQGYDRAPAAMERGLRGPGGPARAPITAISLHTGHRDRAGGGTGGRPVGPGARGEPGD